MNKSICCITGIYPPDIGGPATYVSRLANTLHEQGHRVQVVTLGDVVNEIAPFPVERISRRIPLPLRLLHTFSRLLSIGRSADIWYVNGLELPAIAAGKLLRKRLVMKIVGDYAWERAMNTGATTDLIDDFQHTRQTWKVEAHKAVRSWYVRQVALVITPSQYLKTLVCGWGVPEDRVRVVYNAVEPASESLPGKIDARRQIGLSEHEQYLITVARLVPWKGIDAIIAALPHLSKSVKLLIVGDGPQRQALTALAGKLGIADRVLLLGKLSRIETFRYLRAADIFILNTTYEGFSHVLLEAMMIGTPVVTTPVGGNPELVRHRENGILLSDDKPDTLSKQLQLLLDDVDLQEHIRIQGQRSAQRYSWDSLVNQTIDCLLTFVS